MVCLILITIVSLVLAIVQSYKARTISDEFSESKYVGIVVICWLQLLVVSLPLMFIVDTNPRASYFLKTALIFVTSTSLLLLIFVPKMVLNRRQKNDKHYNRNVRISISLGNQSSRNSENSGEFHSSDFNLRDGSSKSARGFNGSSLALRESSQGFRDSTSRSINGHTRGMRVINPQLEILDLQNRNKMLQAKNEKLQMRNMELERLLCRSDDANGLRPNWETVVPLKSSGEDQHGRSSADVVRFNDDVEESTDDDEEVEKPEEAPTDNIESQTQ